MWKYRAKTDRVIDGDTLDLVVDLGFHVSKLIRVRLLDVDTPELRDRDPGQRELAKGAKRFVHSWLPFEDEWPLIIETEKADGFGRWLAYVKCAKSKRVLNEELVYHGHATYYGRDA